MKRNVLFIVYYLPPMGASGVQRPLKFIKYLSECGWHPIVLAPSPGAYHTFDESLMEELNSCDATVHRVDASTPFHKWSGLLSWIGKLPQGIQRIIRQISNGIMLPDNKKGWIEPAVNKAVQLLDEYQIEIIFSTAPPYSNHLVATRLKKETDLPVVMDFRDDWLESQFIEYPTRWHKKRMAKMERETVRQANIITVLDSVMEDRFHKRLGEDMPECQVIPHGYDPADFEYEKQASLEYKEGKLNLLHSGIFIHVNQPDPFLKAVKEAMERNTEMQEQLVLHFQGGLTRRQKQVISELDLEEYIMDYGYLSHDQAVANLQKADALWFISDYGEEHQQVTTGKLFEYIGSEKPILGLVNKQGEEERILKNYAASYRAHPGHQVDIVNAITNLFRNWQKDNLPEANKTVINRFDRRKITGQLAKIFDKYAMKADQQRVSNS